MKKSLIRTGKRPKKFKILRAYSILSYGRRLSRFSFVHSRGICRERVCRSL